MKMISTPTGRLLAKAMDTYAMRQKVLASNVSNIDTPGYKAQTVSFEEKLRDAQKMGNTVNKQLDRIDPEVEQQKTAPVLENEMMKLSDNQIRFQFATKAMRINGNMLQSAIRERIS